MAIPLYNGVFIHHSAVDWHRHLNHVLMESEALRITTLLQLITTLYITLLHHN